MATRRFSPCICWPSCSADKEGVIPAVLEKIGVPRRSAGSQSAGSSGSKLPKVSGASAQPGASDALNQVFDQAFKEAEQFKDDYVSTEHLLLALTSQDK